MHSYLCLYFLHMNLYTYREGHTYMHACMHSYVCVCTYMHTYIRTYMLSKMINPYVHIYIDLRTYVLTYIHTDRHAAGTRSRRRLHAAANAMRGNRMVHTAQRHRLVDLLTSATLLPRLNNPTCFVKSFVRPCRAREQCLSAAWRSWARAKGPSGRGGIGVIG